MSATSLVWKPPLSVSGAVEVSHEHPPAYPTLAPPPFLAHLFSELSNQVRLCAAPSQLPNRILAGQLSIDRDARGLILMMKTG